MSHATPKRARNHRRKANSGDKTRNTNAWRIEGSWDHRPDLPVVVRTSDRKHARRVVRELVAKGAYVIFQEHAGWDRWTTIEEFDGPALLAEAAAEEQLAAAGHPPAPAGYQPDAADRHRTWLAWMEARAVAEAQQAQERTRAAVEAGRRRERLAVEAARDARALMMPPAIVRPEHRQRARHITGAQR
ncbi:hypothetical protein OG814_11705 [Streptomyces zaomyceticus]|uniref:Uncharacterized protein n=1 Tax=Streptomyces zaomyceticus TaxID=68286 RepID=A0ABZ1L938_9ACTN